MLKRLAVSVALAVAAVPLSVAPASADTPGCVTRAEFYAVHKGDTMARVHRVWDTDGRFRFFSQGVMNRGYKICNVQGTNVFAEYTKRADDRWHLVWKKANAQ